MFSVGTLAADARACSSFHWRITSEPPMKGVPHTLAHAAAWCSVCAMLWLYPFMLAVKSASSGLHTALGIFRRHELFRESLGHKLQFVKLGRTFALTCSTASAAVAAMSANACCGFLYAVSAGMARKLDTDAARKLPLRSCSACIAFRELS